MCADVNGNGWVDEMVKRNRRVLRKWREYVWLWPEGLRCDVGISLSVDHTTHRIDMRHT